MITISYQQFGTKGFQLRLRFYQSGETKYINVTKLLKGNIQKKHWNPKKQMFIPSCPFSEENNAILVQFKMKYEQMAINWNGSIFGMIAAMEGNLEDSGEMTIHGYFDVLIKRLKEKKHADGSTKGTFEEYQKCDRRLEEFCKFKNVHYFELKIKELSPAFINSVLDWVEKKRNGKGMRYISKTLHSFIAKAEKDGHLNLDDFAKCNWQSGQKASVQKYNTLTEEQIRQFAEMDLSIFRSEKSELYRDFCMFILCTGQSPCDALTLRYSDIQKVGGVSHFIFKRRKIAHKQSVPCAVPISQEMDRIMLRWRDESRDGYIFPVRTKKKIEEQGTNNGDIKHFLCYLNYWLKLVGKELGCTFPLHAYTFRHTAITRYISKGVPVVYVSNMMGTSVENCEKIYYNNQGDSASRNKALAAMKF